MHRKWWLNDPDCLVIRDVPSGLSEPEAQTLATLVALSAGVLVDSDDLPEIPPERVAWLTRLIPPLPEAATPLDWFTQDHPKILALPLKGALGSWTLVALVNWEARPVEAQLDLTAVQLDPDCAYAGIDFWRERPIASRRGMLRLGILPAHGARLISLRRLEAGLPTWLGDTLHISQGLTVGSWRVEEGRVRAELADSVRSSSSIWLHVPGSFQSAQLDGHEVPFKLHGSVVRLGVEPVEKAVLDVRWRPDADQERGLRASPDLAVRAAYSGDEP